MIIEQLIKTRDKENPGSNEEEDQYTRLQTANSRNKFSCGFINSRGWNISKWRILIEEWVNLDITSVLHTSTKLTCHGEGFGDCRKCKKKFGARL